MIVKDVIAALQRLPQDLPVVMQIGTDTIEETGKTPRECTMYFHSDGGWSHDPDDQEHGYESVQVALLR